MLYLTKYQNYISDHLDITRAPDTYSRNNIISQDKRKKEAPHISGYWYLCLVPPIELVGSKQKDYVQLLNACANMYSPPSRSITKQEIVGFGGIKKNLATSQVISNSFSITFMEHGSLEIFNVLSHWASFINPFIGNITKSYKGQCIIILAKPTFTNGNEDSGLELTEDDIDEIIYFDGVFPESQPIDKFDSNIESNEVKSIDMTFNFDGTFMTKVFDFKNFLFDFNITMDKFKPHKANTEAPVIQTL